MKIGIALVFTFLLVACGNKHDQMSCTPGHPGPLGPTGPKEPKQ